MLGHDLVGGVDERLDHCCVRPSLPHHGFFDEDERVVIGRKRTHELAEAQEGEVGVGGVVGVVTQIE